jgi:hypothetical protein
MAAAISVILAVPTRRRIGDGQRRPCSSRPGPFEQLGASMCRYAADETARLGRLADLVEKRPKKRK